MKKMKTEIYLKKKAKLREEFEKLISGLVDEYMNKDKELDRKFGKERLA